MVPVGGDGPEIDGISLDYNLIDLIIAECIEKGR